MVLNNDEHDCCYNCQKPCNDSLIIKAVGHIYHKQCFRCDFCQIPVIDKYYVTERDYGTILLCETDYYEHYQYQCNQCKRDIENDEYEMIGQFKYHPQCLRCPGCQISSVTNMNEDKERFEYNGKPYCRFHYSMIKGTECAGCGQAILHHYKLKDEVKWHPECYMLKKYWQVELIDLLGYESNYKSKCQLISIQDDFQVVRETLWKETSYFEDFTSRTISNIIIQSNDSKKQYETCLYLVQQASILFNIIDCLFTACSSNLPCEQLVFIFSRDISLFLEMLNQSNSVLKIAEKLSNSFKDLLKLSLQQLIVLTGKFGADRYFIQELFNILSSDQPLKSVFDLPYLNDHLQLIHSAISKRFSVSVDSSHTINQFPNMDEQSDETLIYKASKNTTPTRSAALLSTMSDISRSQSTTSKHEDTKTYMDTLKRALTTNRKKQSHRQKFYSVHQEINTSPLHISLPDVEQTFSTYTTTPPLSPPTTIQQQLSIPTYLPELNQQQQDQIIRHLSLLYFNHMDEATLEDVLKCKKNNTTASSLWGKLKTHILTPTSDTSTNPIHSSSSSMSTQEKIIGVSLTNLSSGSLSQPPTSTSYENWAQTCPCIKSCFSQTSLVPNFLRDCILAIIDQDMHTEGLFRKNGNIRGIKEICETINASPERQDWADYFRQQPIIQLTAFVKKFLRELPEPLLTTNLYRLFLSCNKATTPIEAIHYTICLLPKPNRDILFVILALLNWVARHSNENKMDYENLARVIAPNILYVPKSLEDPKSAYTTQDISTCHGEISIVAYMIEHYETLIKVPNKFVELLKSSVFSNYIEQNSIDLASTKQFIRNYNQLLKIKKNSSSHVVLPPSPSISSKYNYPLSPS